jgi:ferredoxin-nitrate reductase
MDFRDKDGGPLITWTEPEEAFDAFKAITMGHLADYSGISYAKLRERGFVQWPCNDAAPEGTPRLYTDFHFQTDTHETEDFGHDLLTGAAFEEIDHQALQANGRGLLKPAEYVPPVEGPSERFPLQLTTGRRVYHWHTRTKTGRARELQAAEPEVWVELHQDDAAALGIGEGDRCVVTSPRGSLEAPARLTGKRPGRVFVPFHYGYWDEGEREPAKHGRAANELTITAWDPVSKQPLLKNAAVRVERAP